MFPRKMFVALEIFSYVSFDGLKFEVLQYSQKASYISLIVHCKVVELKGAKKEPNNVIYAQLQYLNKTLFLKEKIKKGNLHRLYLAVAAISLQSMI